MKSALYRSLTILLVGIASIIGIGLVVPQTAQAATCKAYIMKINSDINTHQVAADFKINCPGGLTYVKLHHPTSSDGPCHGYGGGSGIYQVHYAFYPGVSWQPIGTGWTAKYCGEAGSGNVPLWSPSGGGGGSW